MATINEDYVSFKTAKLLKEKGFNEECEYFYDEYENEYVICSNGGSAYNDDEHPTYYSMPTQQMAMKWLREVHNIHIDIDPDWASKGGFAVIGYCFNIHSIVNPWYEDLVTYPTYEQAVEAAIKYCLENLI